MKARALVPVGLVLAATFTAGCDESTSGAEREARRSRFSGDSGSSNDATGGGGTSVNGGCGDVTVVGSCRGNVISFCDEGELVTGDCRSIDPSCACGFDEEQSAYDCLCGAGGAGGGSGSAGAGSGGTSAGSGSGGAPGGSAGTGSQCLEPAEGCGEELGTCCSGNRCVSFGQASPVCAASCVLSSECVSECCALLTSFGGACGPSSACGGSGCRARGQPCDTAADCCVQDTPTVCADPDLGGPKVCTATCAQNSDCDDNCCRTDSHGVRGCFPGEFCR